MADLVTHACTALLVKAATRGPRVPSFVAGVLLPDLLCRVPAIGLGWVHAHVVALPYGVLYGWEPLHLPVGMLLSAFALSLLFAEAERRAIFGSLAAGMLLHLGVDMLQDHFGAGYMVLFPVAWVPVEAGVIGSEDTVYAAGPLALLTGLAWWWRRVRHRAAAVS